MAAHIRELQHLRAEGLGAELAAPVRNVERAFANLSVAVSRVAAMSGTAVEMGRICIAPAAAAPARLRTPWPTRCSASTSV